MLIFKFVLLDKRLIESVDILNEGSSKFDNHTLFEDENGKKIFSFSVRFIEDISKITGQTLKIT